MLHAAVHLAPLGVVEPPEVADALGVTLDELCRDEPKSE